MPKYTIDRIEDHIANLLLQGDESIQKEINVDQLPSGAKEGDVFEVAFEEDGVTVQEAVFLEEATLSAKKRADQLLDEIINNNE